jgi:two-component system sensor histidine kinase/response regulator
MITLKQEPVLLIADDLPDNLQAIIDILQGSQQPYNFISVPNGKVLVDIALKKQPDLIITDWEMPEMSGLSAIEQLKKYPETKDIPVIMCTGIMITPQDLQTALEAGAVDFVRKPVEATELISRVQSMLKLSASYLKIKEQNVELEQLNIIKNRLLSVVSHDVRSPLQSLKGMLYLFDNDALTLEEIKLIIKEVKVRTGQVTDFLENLLHWVKNQFSQTILELTSFDVNTIIADTVNLLQPIAENKKVLLETQLSPDLWVMADEETIKIVIRNLVSNAIKFCEVGDKILVSSTQNDQEVSIHVRDTGKGISPENLQKLFGLQHITTKGTQNEIGTGLGLLLCKQYIERNGGTIDVESEKGAGSHFWFTLPSKQS